MVIASAWSAAFIILFLVFISSPTPIAPGHEDSWSLIIVILLIGAVSGSGWLKFRHEMKKSRKLFKTSSQAFLGNIQ
jgi:hypothetical protein